MDATEAYSILKDAIDRIEKKLDDNLRQHNDCRTEILNKIQATDKRLDKASNFMWAMGLLGAAGLAVVGFLNDIKRLIGG